MTEFLGISRAEWERRQAITRGYRYAWRPQPDITAYELAQCVPAIIGAWSENITEVYAAMDYIDALPAEARRHWTRTEDIP